MPAGWRAAIVVTHEYPNHELWIEIVVTPIVALNTYEDGTQDFAYLEPKSSTLSRYPPRGTYHVRNLEHRSWKTFKESGMQLASEAIARVLPPGEEYPLGEQQLDKDQAVMMTEGVYRHEGVVMTWHRNNTDYERR